MVGSFKTIETKAIHAGEPHPRIMGAISMPIFQSATFEYAGETDYNDLKYVRLNNLPNHRAVSEKLAALENGEAAIVTASGMSAITTTLLTLLRQGDHVLAQNCLYSSAQMFIAHDLERYGIFSDLIDGTAPDSWKAKLRPNTKIIYVESITNPLMQVADLKSIVRFAKEHHLISIIDNTFATPVNFRPLELGFDLVIHSGTKYLNGHSDIGAGACVGSRKLIEPILHNLNHLGGCLDPHAAFLLHRGMKTLVLRVKYQNQSALSIAQFLEKHPAVAKVNYPGLASHPGHAWAKELFEGFSGMLSFESEGGLESAKRLVDRLTIPINAVSLGGVETLIIVPAATTHSNIPQAERQKIGLADGLVRLSVGIEDTKDLIEDFSRALEPELVAA